MPRKPTGKPLGRPPVPKPENEKGFREARREITQAVSASTLGTIFGMSTETTREKIGHLSPVSEFNGAPLYRIRDAAPFLVTPAGIDIEQIVKTLKPAQLPNALQKDFWAAQNTRLKFMEDAKHLWSTLRVQSAVGEILKIVRQRITLLTDTLDRQTALTHEQREATQTMMDTLLEDLYHEVSAHFKGYDGKGDRDELFEEGVTTSFMRAEQDDPDGGL